MRKKIFWILILAAVGFGVGIQSVPNQIAHSQGRGAATPELIAKRNSIEQELNSMR